jgi:PKD domain
VRRRLTVLLICALALLVGAVSPTRADLPATELPFSSPGGIAVDPVGQHVFVSGGSSIAVLDFQGNIVKTITGEDGASQMALDSATHTLYVALRDANAISEIDTQTLTETTRFSTYTDPDGLVIAGNKLWISCFNDDGTNCHDGSVSAGIVSANLDGTGQTSAIPSWFFATVLAAGGTGGNLLAVGDTYEEPSAVSVYDVSGGAPTLVSSLPSNESDLAFVNGMTFDGSGTNLLASAGSPGAIEAFSFATSTMVSSAEYPTGPYPRAVAISPDGTRVAAGISTGTNFPPMQTDVLAFPTGDATPLRTWSIGGTAVPGNSLAFSPDGSELFVLANDPTSGSLDLYVVPVTGPPDTELASGPDTTSYATTAKFYFSSHDTEATFHCSLDGSTPESCTSPAKYSGLTLGSHTFEVQAVDGNSVDPTGANQTWTINLPDTKILSGPDNPTTETGASFSFSSDAKDADLTFQCSLDFAAPSPCSSPINYSDLKQGKHTFTVQAVNDVGTPDPTGASETWVIHGTGPLTAELSPSSDQVLTGQQVTLDASGSSSPGNIVDYQWDLGDGSFDQDTGSTPTVTTSFDEPGPRLVRLKVTDDLGGSAIASATIGVSVTPPPGAVGVSIDNGDYATNSTAVQLDVVWPPFAQNALISNDGGFGPSGNTQTLPVAATIPWTLASDGSQRLPQIVYLRFPDSASPTVTFTDDIVLDTTTPAVASATVLHSKGRLYKVRLRAKETISGISQVRLSTRRSGGTVLMLRDRTARGILKLSRTFSVRLGARPKWVRAQSAAGNWSKWHRVR